MHCLVVGNGESRRGVNLSKFSSNFIVIGSNAIHRDYEVDHLVCCDRRMIEEAVVSNNTKNTKIYVRTEWHKYFRKIKKDKRIHLVPDIPYEQTKKQDKPLNWGSGTYSLLLAATLQPESITMIGFDLYSTNNLINNLYKGTVNYNDENSKPVDHSYWEYQIYQVFKNFPQIQFKVYNKQDWKIPISWKQKNIHFETFGLIKNLTLA